MTTILVIEDEAPLRQEILEILQFEGFDAIGVENGRLGVEAVRAQPPDLIISDIMMPQLDGYGVLLELRSDPATSTIPFIFLTAKASRPDLRKGMDLGADDYLTKPFGSDELLAAVRARLEKHAAVARKHEHELEALRQVIVHTVPHEIRTPLTGIIGYAQMLAEDLDLYESEMIGRMAHGILKAGMRLWRLVENYLLYAQIEMVAGDAERRKVLRRLSMTAPGAAVEEAARVQAADVDRAGDLALTVEGGDAPVSINDDDLRKIVTELVNNACKFSAAGTPVRVRTMDSDSGFVVEVADSGRGMTPEQVDGIGAYVQFERKLHEQQGVGLGLVIAKRLTELHGGQLAIESAPGQGTTVG
ncbi:MAG: response regulator [Anaerolineae bacterium]|nr:response regulator [Anaerolineae bacterium]